MNSRGIRVLFMDVDGTMTDGKIYMSAQGELMKAFNVKDGYAIARLNGHAILPVIITGRESTIVTNRAKELGIAEVHQGVSDKVAVMKDVCARHVFSLSQAAYIGDDLNDLDAIHACGLSAAPADATSAVLTAVDYKCKSSGGNGAIREFIDYIISPTS